MSEVCGEVKEELQDYEVNDDEYRTFRKSLRKSGEATLEAYWVKRIFLRKDKRQG
jgi:hypothetical protein